jgi:hypothetical protein
MGYPWGVNLISSYLTQLSLARSDFERFQIFQRSLHLIYLQHGNLYLAPSNSHYDGSFQ